eukprot:scaffold43570_cov80-Phaeocystis_antarctica.AAC.5
MASLHGPACPAEPPSSLQVQTVPGSAIWCRHLVERAAVERVEHDDDALELDLEPVLGREHLSSALCAA